jgi:hypothetical protein
MMGILPYQSPEEQLEISKNIAQYSKFITALGYTEVTTGPYTDIHGRTHQTREQFYKTTGWYPLLTKNNIHYGYYQVAEIEQYIHPYDHECEYLTKHGYELIPNLSEDYEDNNKLLEQYYKEHGYCPRWEKHGKYYGHRQALTIENYVYPGPTKKQHTAR